MTEAERMIYAAAYAAAYVEGNAFPALMATGAVHRLREDALRRAEQAGRHGEDGPIGSMFAEFTRGGGR